MSLLFMDVVNKTLERVAVVAGDAGGYVSSTGTATSIANYTASEIFQSKSDIQHSTDLVIQMWNEAVTEIYAAYPNPPILATATITLVTSQREYTLPSDFVRVAGLNPEQQSARSATTMFWLRPYPGGYQQMLYNQAVATMWTGQPQFYAISPANRSLRIDRDPTTDQNGMTYNISYEKIVQLTGTMATETLPFVDPVANSLVPVVAEYYSRSKKGQMDAGIFRSALVRAFSLVNPMPQKRQWGVKVYRWPGQTLA